MILWVLIWYSLGFLDLNVCFFLPGERILYPNFFEKHFYPFLFLFFWEPYIAYVGYFMVSYMPLKLSLLFHFFFFFCSSDWMNYTVLLLIFCSTSSSLLWKHCIEFFSAVILFWSIWYFFIFSVSF